MKPLCLFLLLIPVWGYSQVDSANFALALDSLPLRLQVDSIQHQARSRIDSLTNRMQQPLSELQALKQKYMGVTDSLNRLQLSTQKYTQHIDSLTQSIERMQEKYLKKVDAIRSEAMEKVNGLALPPEMDAEFKKWSSSLGQGLPAWTGVDVPALDAAQLNMPQMPDVPSRGIPGNPLPTIPGGEDINGVMKQVQEVSQPLSDVQSSGIEDQVMKLDQTQAIQEEMSKVGGTSLPSEQESKEMLMQEAQQVATDHFADKQEQLQGAMNQIAKYKQKYANVQSIYDLPKRIPNAMKGKPFVERFIPSLTIQLQKPEVWMLDVCAAFGYRISGKITSGIGWNQRWAYNMDENGGRPDYRIYGPRMYGEYRLKNGFVVRAEGELMNTTSPPMFRSKVDQGNRKWVCSAFTGIKKEYTIMKGLKGNVQIMMSLFDPNNESPYVDMLNMRMGFEYKLKPRKRKEVAQ